MPRVSVDLPEQFNFSMERTVGISEVNFARHLDSVSMVNYLHEARLQFLASLGVTEANVCGLSLVVTDLAIEFKAESFAGDRLILDVGLGDFNRYGFDIVIQVTNSALESVVCAAKQGVVFFDFDRHELCEIPQAFRARLDPILNRRVA